MASSCDHKITTHKLRCLICLELYDDPKVLSCKHTFCKKCLIAILNCTSKTSGSFLKCPICRAITDIEDGNVVNLQTNHNIKSLIDDILNSQKLCDKCDKNLTAMYYCSECNKFLCHECLEGHDNWMDHEITRIEEIKQGKVFMEKKVYCSENHKTKQLSVDLCISCKKLVCLRCWTVKHKDKGHDVSGAEEYISLIETKIKSLQACAKKKTTTIEYHMKCIENERSRVKAHVDDTEAKINEIRKEFTEKITKRCEILINQLESQKLKLYRKLDEMKCADNRLLRSVESVSRLAGDSLKAPLEDDIIVIRDSLFGEIKNVLAQDDPCDQPAIDVGNRAEQLIFQQNSERDQLGIGEVRFQTCKLEYDVPFSRKDDMNVMAPTPDGRMAIGYCSGGIDIFSAEGQVQEKVLMNVPIRKVAFLSDGRYVVCQRSVQNTTSLYSRGQERQGESFDTLDRAKGGDPDLTVDCGDLIYISYRKAKKIQVFSPVGGNAEKIKEIPCNGYEPIQITSYEDLLIVTGVKTIRVIDKEGNIKHRLQKFGFHPNAAVTQNNLVMVAWVKDNERTINIDEYSYSNELSHIRNFITDQKIEKPERCLYYLKVFPSGEIAFCTPDRLYIFN